MTSFAAVAFVGGKINAEAVDMLVMEEFFRPLVLPKLIVVDAIDGKYPFSVNK